MEHHHITAEHLSVGRVREILERRLPLALSDDARARIVRCREYLDRKMENPTADLRHHDRFRVRCATFRWAATSCRACNRTS